MNTTNRNYNKKIKYMVLIIALMLVTIFLTSYAVLTKSLVGKKNYEVKVGTLDFKMQNETNSIRLMNAYPMDDSVGKNLTPYTFTLSNTGTLQEYFRIYLVEDETEKSKCTGCEFLSPNKLKYSLKKNGVESATGNLLATTVIDYGMLTKEQTINYELRIWLDSTATIEESNKYYFGRINIEASQEDINNPTS